MSSETQTRSRLQQLYDAAKLEGKCKYDVQFQDWNNKEVTTCKITTGMGLTMDQFCRRGNKIVIECTQELSVYCYTCLGYPHTLTFATAIANQIDGFILKENVKDVRTPQEKKQQEAEMEFQRRIWKEEGEFHESIKHLTEQEQLAQRKLFFSFDKMTQCRVKREALSESKKTGFDESDFFSYHSK